MFSGCTDIRYDEPAEYEFTEVEDFSADEPEEFTDEPEVIIDEQEKPIEKPSGKTSFGAKDVSPEALSYALSVVTEDGVYTTPALVSAYLHIYHKLPGNYITKNEARKLGWNMNGNTLNEIAPGKSIGGDWYGNYEKKLPKGRYTECDVNYKKGGRGAERLIFDKDGNIYYTKDHYQSFICLFEGAAE